MSKKFRIEINDGEIRGIMKGDKMQSILRETAESIKSRAGDDGYETDVKIMPTRAIASVYTTDKESYQRNLDGNELLKAMR